MIQEWLDTTYWPEDFKMDKDFREYCSCVAKHILWVVCEICPKNFYLDNLRTNEQLPNTESKGYDQGLHRGDTIGITDSDV